ncbi:DNA primase [Jeotgalibacillus aurantiacus]|uniref:DNA primase n=1 Tax=Jeotgalibacillus aurantiacus TaxID=2763266 RepID=UPI001D0BD655|nr:DNA primase [Jeotgalibacillus aurantiacus]
MSERIPEEVVDQIRSKTDIVDIISEYVQLKKQGRNYFGLCPFHGENSPSFSVSPEKQIFHCFGCGAGGNVYTFLMDHDGLSFQEAVVQLGEKAGVDYEFSDAGSTQDHQKTNESREFQDHLDAHELLEKLYHHLLMNTEEGQEALEYLHNRGFTDDQLKTYKVGWALPNWEFAAKLLEKREFSLPSMEQAGLIIKRDDGSYFDRFRGRIMFPLTDERGKTVGFSGRMINPGKEDPKYLNSPETPLFQKNKILFNYHHARGAIRKNKSAVLFEGFADVIAASGIVHNAIATMGTSLTGEHIQQIRRLTDSVVVCYDGDKAGIAAAYRAAQDLTVKGLSVKVAMLPNGLDPDDYIQQKGPDAFKTDIIDSAVSLMSFKLRYHKLSVNMNTEDGRIQYVQAMIREISSLSNAIEKELYLKQLSEDSGVSIQSLQEQLNKIRPVSEPVQPEPSRPVEQHLPAKSSKETKKAYYRAEQHLLIYMMGSEETTYTVQSLLGDQPFHTDDYQALYTYLLAYYENGGRADPGAFMQFIPDRHLRAAAAELSMTEVNSEVTKSELTDCVNEVLKHQKLMHIKEKELALKQAEQMNDVKKATELGMEIFQLWKALKR